jgi:hypothetical protein
VVVKGSLVFKDDPEGGSGTMSSRWADSADEEFGGDGGAAEGGNYNRSAPRNPHMAPR